MKSTIFDRRVIDHFDWMLILLVAPIIGCSFYLIYEINVQLAYKQLAYILVAFGLFAFVFMLPIRRFAWLIPFGYWLGIALLVAVELFGTMRMGAQRWLELPFIHMTIQPSEIFKPFYIMMLAHTIHESPPPSSGYGWKPFFKLAFYILLPFVLIYREPDLGTALLLLLVGGCILIAVGLQRKIWITLVLVCSLGGVFGFEVLLHDYQKKRIYDFISNESSYHVRQSIIAIGSGGLTGKESEGATQTQLRFLPISTSDFIFAYFVERFGFIGALGLIILYLLITLHLLSLTLKSDGDYLVTVTITGVATMIFLYMSINIAMTIGLAPVVGVPLPLFSHGGSSFINFIVLFAIIENLLAFRFGFLYTAALRSLE